jgi:quinone-modifying oxidoreductase subunit QmoC
MIEVSPDIEFIEKLQSASGTRLKTCMQCGACTASCSLSADQDVFPRRQMILAAWGMRDRLLADPYIWTCHQCGDCTVTCPRGISPGDVMAALRQEQIIHYARPRFLAGWISKPVYLPLILLFPLIIIHAILIAAGTLHAPEGPVDYSKFFPHAWLNGSFGALFLLSTAGAVAGWRSFSKSIRGGLNPSATGEADKREHASKGSGSFFSVILRILRHRDFAGCSDQKGRSVSHFLVFWAFIILLFVTLFAILATIFFEYPFPFTDPVKIAGNLGALMLFTGFSLMILERFRKRDRLRSTYTDWFFLGSFWLLTLTGILVETARLMDWDKAYYLYLVHLILVWVIILYYPYTKFAHFIYRTTVLLAQKSIR